MTHFTDWQRTKVYVAQGMAHHAVGETSPYHRIETGGAEFNRYLAKAVEALCPERGLPRVIVSNRYDTHRAHANPMFNHAQFGKVTRPYVVVHEVAHLVHNRLYPDHGVEFTQAFLRGLGQVFGATAQSVMRVQFDRKGVAYDYTQRDDYTRKRARWAAGKFDRVEILLKPESGVADETIKLKGRPEKLDDALVLHETWAGSLGTQSAIVVPYDDIAYIRPD